MAQAKIGFITSGGGGNPTGIGDYVNRLNNAGLTAVIMCNDGDVGIGDALATSGNHALLFRVVRDGSEQYSVPDYSLSPQAAAVKHWQLIRPFFHPAVIANKDRVWVQPINEVDKNRASWLGDFGIELARIANGEGYKVAMFAFSSGEPEPFHWVTPGMVRYLQYCEANHERAAVALHEYDLLFEGMVNTYPWHIGRFEFLYQTCDDLGIRRPLVLITEFGWKLDDVPALSQVIEDLDFAGLVYSQYADVLGAGIWYLGGGHNGIANKVQPLIEPVTNFILTTTYPEPPTEPEPPGDPMPDNLLPNPSFEEGHYNQNGVPELQFPNQWVWAWKTDSGYVRPEFRVQPRNQIPTNEWPLYFVPPPPDDSSWHTLKAFKQGLPIRPTFKLLEALNLPAGKYRFSFWIYPDIHTGVINGVKQWSNNPDACKIRLFWNGVQGNWQSLHPYGGNAPRLITYEWQHGGGDAVVGFQADMPLAEVPNVSTIHNGIWTDAHDLRPVEAPPPPPPPPTGTFEERLWKASIQEQRTNGVVFNPALGLWKQILADGLHVVTHERPFEGVNYQVGEKPDKSERWVYTWTAADGIKRFKWPADPPPPPPPPPTGPTINDVVDQLATHPTLTYTTRPLSAITTLTIHHSVSGGGSNPLAEVKSIAQYHVNTRGWPGIGYHFCIGANGAIYQVNRLTTKSFHAGSYNAPGDENYWSAGICLLGNFTDNQPPQAQLDAARSLVAYLKSQLDTVTAVTRHRDMPGASTQCPGNTSPGWIGYVSGTPSNKIDLLPYLRGDGRQYTVKHAGGQQENFQCQFSGNLFWLVKNSQYETFMFDDNFIYRGIDTSPGPAPPYAERPGALRYYWQHEQGQQWAKWCPRHMAIGETWVGPGHIVEYFYKDNCQPSAANSGNATNTVTLKARYTNKVWNGVTIADSVELWTGTTSEGMFFGYNWSLVSWGNQDGGASAVWELLPAGTPDLERETGCFST